MRTVKPASITPLQGVGRPQIDMEYLLGVLEDLVGIPSPTGYTDRVVHYACEKLEQLDVPFELTRRGAIRATLEGRTRAPARAVVGHLDTLGCMVKELKDNGRLRIVPVGTWSSRFAEGARVTILTDKAGSIRGTIMPLKASGHVFGEEVDTQPVGWDYVEVRTDDFCKSAEDLEERGFRVGNFITLDPKFEVTENGFVVSRHLDDKAGVSAILASIKYIKDKALVPPVDTKMLFTISEEVGSGASAILHGDIAELVAVDIATPGPGQNSRERGVTIGMADAHGPFDYHVTQKLLKLCEQFDIENQRDVFKYYRCDAAAAIEAGNDIRAGLVCFGGDGSHGHERTHTRALESLGQLIAAYTLSPPTFERDRKLLAPPEGFPTQPE